jgi:K+ transporter
MYEPGTFAWLLRLMNRNALGATAYFRIPRDQVVEIGARIAI